MKNSLIINFYSKTDAFLNIKFLLSKSHSQFISFIYILWLNLIIIELIYGDGLMKKSHHLIGIVLSQSNVMRAF